MFRRKLIFIILIILLLAAIILVGVFWYLSTQTQKESLNQNIVNYQAPGSNLNTNENINAAPEPLVSWPEISEEEKLKAQLTKMSSAFAERYGSYSNESDFENLEDLMTFMSSSLKSKTENFIREKRVEASAQAIYYGITTKSLKTELISFSPETGRATFKVSTQRQEIIGSSANARVYYQDIELEMIKEGGVWKINKAIWL